MTHQIALPRRRCLARWVCTALAIPALLTTCATPERALTQTPAAVSPPAGAAPPTGAPSPVSAPAEPERAGPLQVAQAYPAADATNVPLNVAVMVRFNRPVDPSPLVTAVRLNGVPAEVSYHGTTAVLHPTALLAPTTAYTVTLAPAITDASGAALKEPYTFRFVTGRHNISAGATQIPTTAGRETLFRYPYLQADSPRRMKVLWATTTPGRGKVQYQRNGSQTWMAVPASQTRYDATRTGLGQTFYQHEALLDGVEPGSGYRYNVVHDGTTVAEGVPFRSLPQDAGATMRFLAVGDSGTPYSQSRAVRDAMVSRDGAGDFRYPHDFVVGLGDIAYYNGTYADFDLNLFNQLSGKGDLNDGRRSLLATRAFVPVLGNHEYANNQLSVPEAYLESFSNPVMDGIAPDQTERYYSFDSGDAHFVVLDTMKFQGHDTRPMRKAMLQWLDQDLAQTRKKWRIVFFHHAVYAHGPHGTYGDLYQNHHMRRDLVPILQRHNVQLVLNGHDHLYERTKRLQVDSDGKIVRDRNCQIVESRAGTVFVTVGIGGGDLHNRKIEPNGCGTPEYDQGMREWGEGYDFVARRNGHPVIYDVTDREPRAPSVRWGFAHVTVTPAAIHVRALNIQGEVLDDFTID